MADEVKHDVARNPGCELDMAALFVPINRAAVQRRVSSLSGRRTVKKEQQVAFLLRAITCLDLTTLAGDDTPGTLHARKLLLYYPRFEFNIFLAFSCVPFVNRYDFHRTSETSLREGPCARSP